MKQTFFGLFVFLLLNRHGNCGEKEVVQSGQPTHFHMEDRGPEIQVTADAEGVKINAKPAGLNVVAKPGHIPATIPVASRVSTLTDLNYQGNTGAHNSALGNIMQPVNRNPPILRHANEPVMYSDGAAGFAARGTPEDANYGANNPGGTLNPSQIDVPNQFNGAGYGLGGNGLGNGGFGGNGLGNGGFGGNSLGGGNGAFGRGLGGGYGNRANAAATWGTNNVSPSFNPTFSIPGGALGGGLQIPADFADYLRWKSGGGDVSPFMNNAHRRQFDDQDTDHPASFRRHHRHHRHRHFVHPRHRHRHRHHYDDYDDDEDFSDDDDDGDEEDDFY